MKALSPKPNKRQTLNPKSLNCKPQNRQPLRETVNKVELYEPQTVCKQSSKLSNCKDHKPFKYKEQDTWIQKPELSPELKVANPENLV